MDHGISYEADYRENEIYGLYAYYSANGDMSFGLQLGQIKTGVYVERKGFDGDYKRVLYKNVEYKIGRNNFE